MIVDSLWHSDHQGIRNFVVDYAYRNKGFHGNSMLGELLRRKPSEEDRPSLISLKLDLERFMLEHLNEIQYEVYKYEKQNTREATAAGIFKPHRRRLLSYGLDVNEVWLSRYDCELFERTPEGEVACAEYLRAK